jgi:tetratricopeptide (TPR) repeat protein
MKKHIYSLCAVLFVALLMANCTPEDPLISPIKTGLNTSDFDAALAAADSAIELEPNNGVAYYYRAVTLGRIAETNPNVADRKDTYAEMHDNLMTARDLFEAEEEPADEANRITDLTLQYWGDEHNEGIKYATNDSLMSTMEAPLDLAIDHLVNATTINPDSTLSFDVLAQVYYMNNNYEGASGALATAVELEDPATASQYDRLASYYFLSEKPDMAVDAIQEGLEFYPDSVSLIQKLADGLFQIGRTDEALDVMNQLIESDPDNSLYHLVVGTRIYQRVLELNDQITEKQDAIYDLEDANGSDEEIAELQEEIDVIRPEVETLTERAETALLRAAELDEDNPATFNTLGILYQNNSAALFDLRNATEDNDQAAEYDEMARAEARKAMENYEKAAELDPDNTGYWESLFRIYTLLDMRDKAEEAMEKAGM